MYKLGFFLSEQYEPNRVLLSNDLGRFVFLSPEAFSAMRNLTLHHQLQGLAQTHVHRISDAIQPS